MATGGCGIIEPKGKFECAVCLEKFRRPKMLPCFHTFCQSCLQAVAGTSTSLDCPSCRKHTLLPPGGVQALQTNFYVEEGPDGDVSRRLCHVCTEDREATHTCLQCRQRYCLPCRRVHDSITSSRSHSVVALTEEEDEDGCDKGATSRHRTQEKQMVETCPQHPDQKLVLYCQRCKVSICIQCKLTQHEGHPAGDLSDKRAEVKVRVQNLYAEMMHQIQEVDHMIIAINERCDQLQQQGQKMAQDCQGRADTLHEWVNDTCNKAVARIQSVTKLLTESLQSTGEKLQNKTAALEAQRDYMNQVLKGGEDADIVSLEAQLTKCQLNTIDLTQVREELARDMPVLDVKHNPTAIYHQQLISFVGVVDPVQQIPQVHDNVMAGIPVNNFSSKESGVACSSVVTTKKKLPRKIFYSKNTESQVLSMSAISNGRLWVKCLLGGNSSTIVMKLLDSEGQVLYARKRTKTSVNLYTVTGDVVLSPSMEHGTVDLIQSDGSVNIYRDAVEKFESIVSQAGTHSLYLKIPSDALWYQVQFAIGDKVTHSETGRMFMCSDSLLRHISATGEYGAVIVNYYSNPIVKVCVIDETQECVLVSEYKCKTYVEDIRFCMVGGVERLLVIAEDDNKVHVVDHTDGARFLDFLDTGSITLNNPRFLTTDNEGRLWIACNGGSVVLVHL